MKLAFIGASHWHLPLYLEPALALEGVKIVGVADPNESVVRSLVARLGCAGDTNYRALCAQVRPDFVFALGRHCEMAEEAAFLADEGIAFALEKPCGLDATQVRVAAEHVHRRGVFAAVPMVFRGGAMFDALRRMADEGGIQHAAFRFIAGFPSRYREAGCAWKLDPAQSGGGSTANLSVHFFDLAIALMGEARVAATAMSNSAWGDPTEDYSLVALSTPSGICTVETGYLYPAPAGVFDQHYAFRGPRAYVVAQGPDGLEALDSVGGRRRIAAPTTNMPLYPGFVRDVLERARAGRPPLVGLGDMVPVMELVDAAYARAAEETGRRFNHIEA
jgi:predicted dehydrogenase